MTLSSPVPAAADPAQLRAPYAEAVRASADRDWLRLNVPGHAADPDRFAGLAGHVGEAVLRRDVPPLLEGIDLGPDNPMEQALQLAADAWGARRTWFLTNGASQGNRIAALVAQSLGRTLVVQRSVHSSVVDGLVLSGLGAAFVQPTVDTRTGIAHGVTASDLAVALARNPDAAAAYVVTPSYFGAVADVAALARVAHAAGVPLIVDEAWGSHFGFHPALPANALAHGADLVVSSTHKLGGALTQAAMLHLGNGPFADRLEPLVERVFHLTQSTSASSLLLASLDEARRTLVTGHRAISESLAAADAMRAAVRAADGSGWSATASDASGTSSPPTRCGSPWTSGPAAYPGTRPGAELMQEHGVLVEVATDAAVVAVVGAGAGPEAERFAAALHALPAVPGVAEGAPGPELPAPGAVRMTPREAFLAPGRSVPAAQAVGRISADTLSAYPPGIPNVLPGEEITAELVAFLHAVAAAPTGHVRGATDPAVTTLRIVADH
ncbi:aminotransferase class I/II-fold pyridoxal phosphate-dependent enzyme [Kitasatospora arboriphila]